MVSIASIELRQNNEFFDSEKNNRWRVLVPPIELNAGDIVALKNGFLNGPEMQPNQIFIEEDVPVIITCGFYTVDTGLQFVWQTDTDDAQDFVNLSSTFQPMYLMTYAGAQNYDPADPPPTFPEGGAFYVRDLSFTVPAGYYFPTDLANFITSTMSNLAPLGASVNYYSQTPAGELQSWASTPNPLYFNIYDIAHIERNIPLNPPFFQALDQDKYCLWRPGKFPYIIYQDGADIPAPAGEDWFAFGQMMGANQLSLDFNEDTNKFQWTYLHTPIINDGNQVIAIAQTATDADVNRYFNNIITTNGGVFLFDLQPRSFWQNKLGFDVESILMPPIFNAADATLADRNLVNCTTFTQNGLSMPLSIFLPQTNIFGDVSLNTGAISIDPRGISGLYTGNTDPVPVKYVASSGTIPINAVTTYSSDIGAYYKISVDFGQLTKMYSEKTVGDSSSIKNINVVASKYWTSNGKMTIFSDSGISYIHSGPTMYITDFEIKVTDENDNDVQLDPNSVVYMAVETQGLMGPIVTKKK